MRKTVSLRANAILASAYLAIVALPAAAQTAQPTPPMDSVPEKVPPNSPPTQPKSLSDKLDQSNGVIQPKEVDPGIEKPVPKTGAQDVIPPPGTSGGAPAPQPK